MIKSMTGYGRREEVWKHGAAAVEVRAVNHRFCEIVARLPKTWLSLEESVKRAIQRRVLRGRIEVAVSLQDQRAGLKTLSLDRSLAKQYYRAFRELKQQLGLPGSVDLSMLAGTRDIIAVTEQPPRQDRRLQRTILRLLAGALSDLEAMRRREGKALSQDIKKRLRTIAGAKVQVERLTPRVLQDSQDRMRARVEKLLGADRPDLGRLNQEFAIYAERSDVTEELVRLGSHLAQFELALRSREAVGRTLDFLLQEMGREVNTIGSKANDAHISMHVVKIKGELEKIREQVQNIE